MFVGTHGIELIKRYAAGEALNGQDMEAMKATMYLITLFHNSQRSWEHSQWRGPEQFIKDVWPNAEKWSDVHSGLFGHGAISP